MHTAESKCSAIPARRRPRPPKVRLSLHRFMAAGLLAPLRSDRGRNRNVVVSNAGKMRIAISTLMDGGIFRNAQIAFKRIKCWGALVIQASCHLCCSTLAVKSRVYERIKRTTALQTLRFVMRLSHRGRKAIREVARMMSPLCLDCSEEWWNLGLRTVNQCQSIVTDINREPV